jgi:putative Mg2+ transporter-C (MgtC) family protein
VLHTDLHLLARVALGIGVGFVFGYERQLRGSPAGNRTFALIGGTAAGVTAVAGTTSPQAVAGILTGIGFIGAGLVFVHGATVRGLTTASTVFAVAGVGIVFGYGHTYLGLFMAVAYMFLLELQHLPGLRSLDASAMASRFADDFEVPRKVNDKGVGGSESEGDGKGVAGDAATGLWGASDTGGTGAGGSDAGGSGQSTDPTATAST